MKFYLNQTMLISTLILIGNNLDSNNGTGKMITRNLYITPIENAANIMLETLEALDE